MVPVYIDGVMHIYKIIESDDVITSKHLEDTGIDLWYEELSISDRLRSQLNAGSVDVQMKIRIPQYRKLNTMCVVKIDDSFYKVYNVYHFTDKEGFQKSDVTLTNWDGDVYAEK